MSNSLKLLISSERPEQIAHDCSFPLNDLSNLLTVTHLSWAKWAHEHMSIEQWANERIPSPAKIQGWAKVLFKRMQCFCAKITTQPTAPVQCPAHHRFSPLFHPSSWVPCGPSDSQLWGPHSCFINHWLDHKMGRGIAFHFDHRHCLCGRLGGWVDLAVWSTSHHHHRPGLGTAIFSVRYVPFFSILLKERSVLLKEHSVFFRSFLSFWLLMGPKRMFCSFPFFSVLF